MTGNISRFSRRIAAVTLLSALAVAGSFAQGADAVPNDGAGHFAQALLSRIGGSEERLENAKPFAIAFCGWRTLTMTHFSMGKYDGAQIGLCRLTMQVFDPEMPAVFANVESRAKTSTKEIDLTEAEKGEINRFVKIRHGQKAFGLFELSEERDPIHQWKYMMGIAMGELGAYVTMWWKVGNAATFDGQIAKNIRGAVKQAEAAPPGMPASMLAKIKALAPHGEKTRFTPTERLALAADLREAMLASVAITDVKDTLPAAGSRIAAPAAPATPAPVRTPSAPQPRPTPTRAGTTIMTGTAPATPAATPAAANPTLAREKYYIGRGYAESGEHASAVSYFDQSIALNNAEPNAFHQRAKSLEALGRIDAAIADYTQMIILKGNMPLAYYNRGTLQLDKKNFTAALADLNMAIQLGNDGSSQYFNRGMANHGLGKWQAAYADFAKAAELDPRSADSFIMMGKAACKQGLLITAIRAQEQAIALGSNITKGCSQ